ncbi:MAG: tetratricopeptide repeat protein [Deltaproteobacteria bacterium]|nr:MAG: tetratricopeptide repeat protein [Deltaproteobacteria bacterium]
MEKPNQNVLQPGIVIACALLFILIFGVYSNSFQAAWHLDDYQNIVNNPRLKITDLSPGSIKQTFYAFYDKGQYQSRKLYRPIPCLTFGLNYYFGQLNPFGYHLVNTIIHFLSAAILFLTILSLFQTPNLADKNQEKAYFIALLSAVLWAVNPIQTQAVTYIVQRMAAMATLFYLMGLFFYLRGRLEQSGMKRKVIYFIYAFLSFLLALGSKENAVTLPVAVIMVEMIFFQDLRQPAKRKRFLLIFAVSVFAVLLVGAFIFLESGFGFLKGYGNRPFTLGQRLLTEPRVLVFYLSQIFYPVPGRLSIDHDMAISTSFFHPWTTLPSILFIFCLIGWSFSQIHKRPLISFAVLFYFLNHLIESSIIPLELIFEHRNYLPSLFLFLPISAGLNRLLNYYVQKNRIMYAAISSFITLLVIGLGMGTFIRNLAWASEKSLWEDALRKAPQSSRPYHNLAWAYYDRLGQDKQSLELYQKALALRRHNVSTKQMTLGNIANIYYKARNYQKAAELWTEALSLYPKNEIIRHRLATVLTKLGDLDAASEHMDFLIARRSDHTEYLNLMGYILMKQGRFKEALPYFRRCLKQNPHTKKAMINRGACLNVLGEYRAAEWALRYAYAHYPQDILPVLWLIDTNVKTGDAVDIENYFNRLFKLVGVNELVAILEKRAEDNLVLFPNSDSLYRKIAAVLKDRSDIVVRLQHQDRHRLE